MIGVCHTRLGRSAAIDRCALSGKEVDSADPGRPWQALSSGLMGELRAVEPTATEQRDDRARAPQPDASGAATPVLLAMQRAAGNRAVSGLVRGGRRSVQRLDDNMAATLSSRADQQIAEARRGQDASRSGDGSDQAAPSEPPSAEQVAAEKTRQKAAIRGVVTPPDTSGAQSETAATAQAVQSEAAKPPSRSRVPLPGHRPHRRWSALRQDRGHMVAPGSVPRQGR